MSAADRAIRVSTAAAVLGVAGIAAYVSYWHAFEVVRAHGESGVTARLEPATIDGLVYSSSMVVLYAARHQLPRRPWPGGCWRWASLPPWPRMWPTAGPTDQLAPRSQHGPLPAWSGATSYCSGSSGPLPLAPWPANRLRTRQAVQRTTRSLGCGWSRRLTRTCRKIGARPGSHARPGGPGDRYVGPVVSPDRTSGPAQPGSGHAYRSAVQETTGWSVVNGGGAIVEDGEEDINVAAVAAYRASLDTGAPLSERKLAAMFGKTSRRWARNRMADARDISMRRWHRVGERLGGIFAFVWLGGEQPE